MALVGEPIPDYTQNQIKSRQKIHGKGSNPLDPRTNSDLVYLNSRNAWIKFASGVELNGSSRVNQIQDRIDNKYYGNINIPNGQFTAGNFILFNSVSTYDKNNNSLSNDTYGVGYSSNFNTVTSYGYFSTATSFGPTPPPGITSLDIKALNRGSIKKASIKIKAYNSLQFDIIDVLYLRLGYTMLIEWGDSHFLDGDNVKQIENTLIEQKFFKTNNGSYPQWLTAIEDLRDKFKGCYDGFYGRVTNFTWEFKEDGTYDINIDLHSQGDIIESLTLSSPPTNTSIERTHKNYPNQVDGWVVMPPTSITTPSYRLPLPDGGYEDLPGTTIDTGATLFFANEFSSIISNYFKDIIKPQNYQNFTNFRVEYPSYNYPTPIPAKPLPTNKGTKLGYVLGFVNYAAGAYTQVANNILFKIDNSGAEYTYKTNYPTESVWVPSNAPTGEWYFLDEIVKIYSGDNSPTDTEHTYLGGGGFANISGATVYTNYIRFGCLLQLIEKLLPTYKNGNTPLIKFSNKNFNKEEDKNLMYTFPNHYSINPKVCIINTSPNSSITTPYQPYPGLRKFKDKPTSSSGKIMNIYLNIDYILSLLPDTPTDSNNTMPNIFNLFSKICNSINTSLGSVNNLEPIVDPETNVLSIIDSSRVEKSSYDPIIVYGYNDNDSNFIRKFDLKTQISKEYATMITIGATAGGYSPGVEATAFSNWNKGIIDRFHEEVNPDNLPSTGSDPVKSYLAYTTTYNNSTEDVFNKTNNHSSLKTFGLKPPTDITKLKIKRPNRILGTTPQLRSGIYNVVYRAYGFLTNEELDKSQQLYNEYCRFLHSTNSSKTQTPSPTIGFLPFGINLTMDGLSGFKIYNKIIVDTRLLPSNYPTALEFVVKGVDHSIKNNDWETTIRTIAVPKNPESPTIPEFTPKSLPTTPTPPGSSGNAVGVIYTVTQDGYRSAVPTKGNKKTITTAYDLQPHHSMDAATSNYLYVELDSLMTQQMQFPQDSTQRIVNTNEVWDESTLSPLSKRAGDRFKGWSRAYKGLYVKDNYIYDMNLKASGLSFDNTPIPSPIDGTVEVVAGSSFNTVNIKNNLGQVARILHSSKILVSTGDTVSKGDHISIQGDVGSPGDLHTHIELPTKQILINYIESLNTGVW